jgi:hypothetical protein
MKKPLNKGISSCILLGLIFSIFTSSCGRRSFSQDFISRFGVDSAMMSQMYYFPNRPFNLQYGIRNIKFKDNNGSYVITRFRNVDEYLFTPKTRGIMTYYSKDTVKIQFSDSTSGVLRFVRDTENDRYFLSPDTILGERFIINYLGYNCISSTRMPKIKLTVQGVELTKVKRNRKLQTGVSKGNISKSNSIETEKPKKAKVKPAPIIE